MVQGPFPRLVADGVVVTAVVRPVPLLLSVTLRELTEALGLDLGAATNVSKF